MVNRSRRRNMRRGRRMRGGEGIFDFFSSPEKTQEQRNAAANNPQTQEQRNAAANNPQTQEQINASANNPENSSWSRFMPTAVTDAYTSTKQDLGNFAGQTKEEGDELLNKAKNLTSGLTLSNPFSSDQYTAPGSIGGKRRSKHMKGGQNLGLNYYATPVNGIKMAQPTYMEYYKGGKRRKTYKKRRSCKRRTCKRHRRR